ncbi:hypothetical protein [Epilithonimonas tenax]|uniref:hypothetical protein n=1 Tax=Epilithonimonas tenax TaxID=191577 RepID=UPI0003FD8164|nr:hypothetical protein [Epilithonimonas tenax]
MEPDKKQENANASEQQKQTEDFRDMPASSDKKNPPNISKKDIDKSFEVNKDGKTDNTKK